MSSPGAYIGIRPGLPQRWLIPARYRAQWQVMGGRIVRRALGDEVAAADILPRPKRYEQALEEYRQHTPSEAPADVRASAGVLEPHPPRLIESEPAPISEPPRKRRR